MMGVGMYVGGQLQKILGIRGAALCGGWLLSLGVCLTSISVRYGSIPVVMTYGLMLGTGISLAYTAPVVCLLTWMPDRKGLASGLVVVAFGSGATVFDIIQEEWVNPYNMEPRKPGVGGMYYDWNDQAVVDGVLSRVPSMFLLLAPIYLVLQTVGAALLFQPYGVAGMASTDLKAGLNEKPEIQKHITWISRDRQFTALEMIRTRQFWCLTIAFMCNTAGVFFAFSRGKTLGNKLLDGISDEILTRIISFTSIANGAGRIFWGLICDYTSFRIAMVSLCTLQACMLLVLPFCRTVWSFSIAFSSICLCCGGNFSLFPAGCATLFGGQNMASNYGIVYLGQSIGMVASSSLLLFIPESAESAVIASSVALGGLSAFLVGPPSALHGDSK